MAGKRVLIVDDDPALLVAFREALRLRMPEVAVDVAESGNLALKLLAANDYDAIVSDIKMPGMDGLTLLTEISNRNPDVPTLLITGHGQQDLAVRALRGGAFDFIQKPIDRDYITVALSRAFQVRQLKRQIDAQRRKLEEHAAGLEVAVQQRTQELVQANQAKDEFLAMLAHELRNPLASICTAASLMALCEAQTDPHTEALAVVQRQVQHMTRLLDDLLDVSRITRQRIKLHKKHIDLGTVVRSAADGMSRAFNDSGHEFTVRLPPEPLTVEGDPTRLEQVVANLLNNAAKYTDRGGHVNLTVERAQQEAVINVVDDGIGIAPDMLPRIFELFSQADRSLDRSQGGLGIGLTLVQKLVEFHGGTVAAHSNGEGCGTRFTVRLPLSAEQPNASPPAEPANCAITPRRILLVDDNTAIVRMTSMLLTRCGHEVVAVATDGPAAIDAVYNHEPEVVLLDIGLPKLDGYEVARRLRMNEGFRDLVLIAMTGYGREEDQNRSRAAGFDYHVVKPVTVETLQEILTPARTPRMRCDPAVS